MLPHHTQATAHFEVQCKQTAGGTPYIAIGTREIKPERLPAPVNSSDIYISVLTAPVYHNSRFALQYLTWLQTVDPKNVSQKVQVIKMIIEILASSD